MRIPHRTLIVILSLVPPLVAVTPGSFAVEAGVDIAAPRVAITDAGASVLSAPIDP